YEWMSLKALEFLVRGEIGIFVIEMHHEADRHESVVELIKERATPRAVAERPAKRVLYQPSAMFFRRDLPQLLETEPKSLRFAPLPPGEARLEYLGEAATGTLGEQRVLRTQLHAAGEAILVMPVLRHAHVAGGDACHCAVAFKQHLGGGKSRIDFNTQSS